MQKSLIINSVDQNGVAKAKSITNINPEASNEQLQEFAQPLTALSTNTYSGASVVTKTDVTEAVRGGVTKKVPTLTFDIKFGPWSSDTFQAHYDGDGKLCVVSEYGARMLENNIVKCGGDVGDGIIYALETDNYYSVAKKFYWSD